MMHIPTNQLLNHAKYVKTPSAIPNAKTLLDIGACRTVIPAPFFEVFAWYTVNANEPPQICELLPAQARLHEDSGSLAESADRSCEQ